MIYCVSHLGPITRIRCIDTIDHNMAVGSTRLVIGSPVAEYLGCRACQYQ